MKDAEPYFFNCHDFLLALGIAAAYSFLWPFARNFVEEYQQNRKRESQSRINMLEKNGMVDFEELSEALKYIKGITNADKVDLLTLENFIADNPQLPELYKTAITEAMTLSGEVRVCTSQLKKLPGVIGAAVRES